MGVLDESVVVSKVTVFFGHALRKDVVCGLGKLRNVFVTEIDVCCRFRLPFETACYGAKTRRS